LLRNIPTSIWRPETLRQEADVPPPSLVTPLPALMNAIDKPSAIPQKAKCTVGVCGLSFTYMCIRCKANISDVVTVS